MTVNSGISGLKYFKLNIIKDRDGLETVVFVHLRDGVQLEIKATKVDFYSVTAAGFNVQVGDVAKVYIVDELTNDLNSNPIVLQ